MVPGSKRLLISVAVLAGLFVTTGCGSQKTSSGTFSAGTGSSDGVTISNEVSAPSEMNIGDIIMLQFNSSDPAQLDFDSVDDNSQYYLVVGSLDYGYGTHSVMLNSSLSSLDSKELAELAYEEEEQWESWTAADAFHQRLHDVGYALSMDPDIEMAGGRSAMEFKAAVVAKAAGVGDTEQFRVLNSLSNLSNYATVTGRVKCVRDNVVIYLDTEVEEKNSDDLEDGDIQMLCENFDEQVALERSLFGEESDVNEDGKVAALLTPQVNRLGSMGGGIITGFFLASDLYSRSGSNSISNEREIVYTMVPDSDGIYGLVIPKTFAIENLLTAVLPHELQHAISYNQHVFEGEGSPELNWLNEGMSHLTEDLVGYGQENYSRAAIFLNNPGSYQVVDLGSPGLGARGASYLFMRFLYEQHPDPTQFLWGLYHKGTNGVANLEEAYDGSSAAFDQFGEFFMRWMVAVAMTNRGLSADSRYVYRPRVYNSSTGRWQGICLVCDADDGRGTTMSGPYTRTYSSSDSFSLYSSSARFYNVSTVPEQIVFDSTSSGNYGAVLIRKQ